MEITIEINPDCTAALTGSIPAETVKNHRQRILGKYAAQVKLPGFRPGKTPVALVAKKFSKEIEEEVIGVLTEALHKNIFEKYPKIKIINFSTPTYLPAEDGTYAVNVELTVVNEFTLPEYKGIEVSTPKLEVTDQMVDDEIIKYARSATDFTKVERPIEMNDVAVVDFSTECEGKPVAEVAGKPVGFLEGRTDQWMPIAPDSFIPGLAEALVGLNSGEKKDVTITLPEDFPFPELHGKEITFHLEIKEIKTKENPVLSDELANKLVEGSSLDELRNVVRINMEATQKNTINELKADQITEKLADKLDFTVPAAVIDSESHGILQRKLQAMLQSGKMWKEEEMDGMREEAKIEAERNLKVYFMIQDVARAENITVTEREMIQRINQLAQEARKEVKAYVRELQKSGQIDSIRTSILTAKTIDFLVENSVATGDAPPTTEA